MMKNVLAAAITSAAMLMASGALADGGPAPAPPPPPVYEAPPPPEYNWYTTIFAGVVFGGDLKTDVAIFDPVDPALDEFFTFTTPLNTGYLLGWTVGYRPMGLFGSDWFAIRPEAELSFRRRNIDFTELFGDFVVDGGDPFNDFSDPAQALSLLFNGWIDFNFAGVSPYIGGGIGVAWRRIPTPTTFIPALRSTGFAWQAGAGVNFDVSDRVFLGIGYRYFRTGFNRDVAFVIDGDFFNDIIIEELPVAINFDNNFNNHEVLFNMGVRF